MKVTIFVLVLALSSCYGNDEHSLDDACIIDFFKNNAIEHIHHLRDIFCLYKRAQGQNNAILYNNVSDAITEFVKTTGCPFNDLLGPADTLVPWVFMRNDRQVEDKAADVANKLIEEIRKNILDKLEITEDILSFHCRLLDPLLLSDCFAEIMKNNDAALHDVLAPYACRHNEVESVLKNVRQLMKNTDCDVDELLGPGSIFETLGGKVGKVVAEKLINGLVDTWFFSEIFLCVHTEETPVTIEQKYNTDDDLLNQ
ncbi:uncharacterized protein LOC142495422 isoform X1 [Ascaphus truei]|uniref:uncharacterized protein LOC142495422 isoform X1 n=1 Tax=Ascaphus truei TaxID=8439 RepID=UPI003F5959D5